MAPYLVVDIRGLIYVAVVILVCTVSASAFDIETVVVGDAANAADLRYVSSGVGSVPYRFRMGKTEITNAQYAAFLNAVAASDPFQLYSDNMAFIVGGITRSGSDGSYSYVVKPPALGGSYDYNNKPAIFVSWFDALRFANWLHNGQGGLGTTENGAYTLLGGTPTPSNWQSITRNPGARWWLPNDDEWYKAAYYDPSTGQYFEFPTRTNTVPNNNLPTSDTGNSANFTVGDNTTGSNSYPLTDVNAYMLSAGPYGTFDQAGNVREWIEQAQGTFVTQRGGSWDFNSIALRALIRGFAIPADETIGRTYGVGFRVASVIPEPSTLLLGALAGMGLLRLRRHGS